MAEGVLNGSNYDFYQVKNTIYNFPLQTVIQMSKEWKTVSQQYGSHYGKSSSLPKKVGSSTLEYIKTFDKGNFIQEQQNIAQRFRHGLFSQPGLLATGDVYQDKKPDKPEKRVEVNNRMQQKVGPQLFSKLSSTNLNDPYKDSFRAQQLYNLQKNALSIHPNAFAAGGKQKLVKHSEFQHNKQYNDKIYNTRDQNGKVKVDSKQIMTNNMKKGFGNTTVGHLFSDYPYIGAPYDANKQAVSQQKLEHKAKIAQPFIGSSHPSKTFAPDYLVHQPLDPYQEKTLGSNFRGKSVGNWKYNNPNKKGYNGTFERFPQYIEQGEKQKKIHPSEKIWIPNFNGTSKGLNQTLSKPCPAPSQLILNQIKRTTS